MRARRNLSGAGARYTLGAMDYVERLRESLASHRPRAVTEWDARPAAVLVPFYELEGEWHLLFTERTHLVESHKGQVSFPGGARDPEDCSLVDTALRESEEEIGLQRDDVTVLGCLDELLSISQFRITPVVGVFPYPYHFCLNAHECSEVFGVPFAWLSDPANVELRRQQVLDDGLEVPVYHYREYAGHTIWGVTARILQMLFGQMPGAAEVDQVGRGARDCSQ